MSEQTKALVRVQWAAEALAVSSWSTYAWDKNYHRDRAIKELKAALEILERIPDAQPDSGRLSSVPQSPAPFSENCGA